MELELLALSNIEKAKENLQKVVIESELQKSQRYSSLFNSSISLKREDLQKVRSFKIRGAFNKISSLNKKKNLLVWFVLVLETMLKV